MVEGWESQQLGALSSLITSGSRGWGSFYATTGDAFLRITNLPREGIRLRLDDLRHVQLPKDSSEGQRTRVRMGDILISITAELGKIGFVDNSFDAPAYVNQHVCLVRPKTDLVYPEFLAAYLAAYPQRNLFNRLNDSGAKSGLNLGTIEAFPVRYPPLPEQRRIAEILRTWDEAIEKLEALRAAKEQRRDALTYSLVFGARQLIDFDDQGQSKKHRWFDLPASWDCKPVGAIASEVSERNGDGDHEVLSCSKYDGFVRSLEYFKKQVFSSDLSGYKVIRRGEFGFPSNHVEEGSIGLQNLVDIGLVSPIYTVFRFDPEAVDNEYAFTVLKTSLYRHIFEVSTSASVDRRGSLRWTEFSKIPFPLPPLEEQREIMAVIQAARADVEATAREITALQRQKRGLMQKLLTGEWRVTVDPSQSPTNEKEAAHG